MKYLIVFCSLFLFMYGHGQSECNFKSLYPSFLNVGVSEHKGETYFYTDIKEIREENCLKKYVNNNTLYFDYFIKNYRDLSKYRKFSKIKKSEVLQKAYFEDLNQDTLFGSVISDYVDKVVHQNQAKDTISLETLMDVAVKFFNITGVNPMGYYSVAICVGRNAIKSTLEKRYPHVEAFCFSAIYNGTEDANYKIFSVFQEAVKELYSLNLGVDKDEKLLRAQGAMFMLMKDNKTLHKLLLEEFEREKENLPFIVAFK